MPTKTRKIKPKLAKKYLPKITRGKENKESNFPVDHLSYSSMVKLATNPILFRIQYINRDVIETAHSASSVLGNAFHFAIDTFFKSDKDHVAEGLRGGLRFIGEYPEGFIKWTTGIPDRQTMLEKLAFAYNHRILKLRKKAKDVQSELKIEEFIDVEWHGKRIALPIKLKGFIDRLYRDQKGRLIIEDDKVCASFSNPDKIDGKKMLQAVQYYFLVYAATGEEPYMIKFVETKHTKSRDGVQTQPYDYIFKDNEIFFDFYLRFYDDVVRALMGEQVFLPNLDTMFDNEISIISYIHRLDEPDEVAKQQKILKVDNITEILKKKLTSVKNMRALKKAVEKSLVEYKNIDYSKMSIQEKITTKLMEHGIVLSYDSVIDGNSFSQYRFSPSIGVKMSSLRGYAADIEQAIGMSGVRIVAPIPDTSFIGIEIPKKDRRFTKLSHNDVGTKAGGLPLGIGQSGDIVRLTLDDMPHIMVAGSTGSGKSIFLNCLIQSIISQDKSTKLYLIDPKMVELSQFLEEADAVAYEPLESMGILAILIEKMQGRYVEMRKKKAKSYRECGMDQIVCVIDEFADLIMSSKKKNAEGEGSIEEMIIRLAQKGRAAGIHLVIATQRPDSKVITGLIKANFPTKVAFATSSETNSRIILDEPGAEKLLGKGDGLISHPSFTGLRRFQGFYL